LSERVFRFGLRTTFFSHSFAINKNSKSSTKIFEIFSHQALPLSMGEGVGGGGQIEFGPLTSILSHQGRGGYLGDLNVRRKFSD
jgi:hypothetical protein